jgi:hypothetical protein
MAAINEKLQWEPPLRNPTKILVWRKEWRVHHRPLEPGECAALKIAADGTDFATICATLASELEATAGTTELTAIINRMFTGWLRDSLLTT